MVVSQVEGPLALVGVQVHLGHQKHSVDEEHAIANIYICLGRSRTASMKYI